MNLDFKVKYVLENDAVQLRPLELSDYDHLLKFSIEEPDTWKYSLVQPKGEAGLKNYLSLAIKGRESEKEYPFIVFDKKQQAYAGSTRFYDIQQADKCLQLGYTWYGKKFRGTGLNKNCKLLLLEFAFEKLEMERVEFRADNKNERSIAAMKSIGCKVEGVLRSNSLKPDGSRRDSIVLSLLKNEWYTDVKKMLQNKIRKGGLC